MDNDKDSNSVQQIQACSPLTIRDYNYSPSPSTTKNDTPSTTNTSNNTSNRTPTPTPNRTPNPIPTLPANNNIIKLEPHLTFQPLLTSMNHNINCINHHKISRNIPRIPLPNMVPTDNVLALPPLPNDILSSKTGANRKNTQSASEPHKQAKQRRRPQPIKMEMMTRSRSRSRSHSITTPPISSTSSMSSEERENKHEPYNVITSAFNHNLKVKQEHLKHDVVTDTLFESCYIFSMRCPYTNCYKLFGDMASYQSHHIQCHQQRDKKGRLIQTKEAKWKCPDCGKISASWYNYAAHVTMHKDSCDAPWICKLPPINKKKYIQWTDGTFICGKRCSTKHNLIKHLKALHTSHRIIDLSQSVKAQSIHKRNNDHSSYGVHRRRRSPRKRKKRPCFFAKSSISPTSASSTEVMHNNSFIHPPPHKKIKMDPGAAQFHSMHSNALPIYQTQHSVDNWSVHKQGREPQKSVRQQGDFVGLLLEAAQLIETENKSGSKQKKSESPPTPNHNSNCVTSIPNVDALLSSINTLFHSTAQSLSSPVSIDNLSQLSAILALGAAGSGTFDLVKDNVNSENNEENKAATINISNITNISNVSNVLERHRTHIMPDIAIVPNMPALPMKLSPITASNPAISLPKMPLPPPPPNASENQNVEQLLKILNYPAPHKHMLNRNALNVFHHYPNAIPLIPNVTPLTVAKKGDNNTVIANNLLASLPPIHMMHADAK